MLRTAYGKDERLITKYRGGSLTPPGQGNALPLQGGLNGVDRFFEGYDR